jgi:hypothetical protein
MWLASFLCEPSIENIQIYIKIPTLIFTPDKATAPRDTHDTFNVSFHPQNFITKPIP